MPQTESLARYIKEEIIKLAKSSEINCLTIESNKSLVDQAKGFSTIDTALLVKSEKNFQISEELRKRPHLDVNFNPFLAEPLLREGSLLLDRCLQQRREKEELKTKWFEACIQVDELYRLNEITEREEDLTTGNYHFPEKIAEAEKNAVIEEGKQITAVLNFIKSYLDLTDVRDTLVRTNKGRYSGKGNAPGKNELDDYLYELSRQNERELLPFRTQYTQLVGLQLSNNQRKTEAEDNEKLKKSLAAFQRERNNVARLVAFRRAKELLTPSGALNFREQIPPIEERFNNDLAAAWLRLSKAAEGFQMLYEHQLDKLFTEYSPQKGFDFDSLVTWCQNTNTWLASFLDRQQQVTCSLSLKQLLESQGGSISDGQSSGKWQFKLKEEHFYNSKFVRLRGFAIQIDSGHVKGSWNIAITPPTKAKLRNEKEVKDMEQIVGRLYLGRVNETTYQVVPESAAPPKLYNASPIGQDVEGGEWTIEILGLSTESNLPSAILDIDIHLTVALV